MDYGDYTPLESCKHRICSKLWLCGEKLQRAFSTFSAFSPFTFAAGSCVQGTRKNTEGVCCMFGKNCPFWILLATLSQNVTRKTGKVKAFKACSCLGGDGSWAHGKGVVAEWCQMKWRWERKWRSKRKAHPHGHGSFDYVLQWVSSDITVSSYLHALHFFIFCFVSIMFIHFPRFVFQSQNLA